MKRNKKLYVAYGSNLNVEQMNYRCPDATIYGAGVIKNHELTFWGNWNRNGVATVVPGSGTDVPVAVWEISATDEKSLDIYEGWPHLYRKENIEVELNDGTTVTGMIYIMNEKHMRPAYPSDYYYDTIATGYRYFGFNRRFLAAARSKICKPDYRFKKL